MNIPKHRLIPGESYKKSSDKEKYDHEMNYKYYFGHWSKGKSKDIIFLARNSIC